MPGCKMVRPACSLVGLCNYSLNYACQARTLGGVRGVRTNRPLCGSIDNIIYGGSGSAGVLRLHGTWPPCMCT